MKRNNKLFIDEIIGSDKLIISIAEARELLEDSGKSKSDEEILNLVSRICKMQNHYIDELNMAKKFKTLN